MRRQCLSPCHLAMSSSVASCTLFIVLFCRGEVGETSPGQTNSFLSLVRLYRLARFRGVYSLGCVFLRVLSVPSPEDAQAMLVAMPLGDVFLVASCTSFHCFCFAGVN